MPKSVRLDNEVYGGVYEFLRKGETFSQGIGRLLKIAQGIDNIIRRGHLGRPPEAPLTPNGAENEDDDKLL